MPLHEHWIDICGGAWLLGITVLAVYCITTRPPR